MIGQNSPATPVPSTALPSGVGSRRASERIGTSVPSAVVANATAEQPPRRVDAGRVEGDADRQPDRERDPPAHGSAPQRIARDVVLDHLEPGEEEEQREAEVGQERDVLVDVAMSSPSGPMRIPRTISTTTVGSTTRRCQREKIAPSAEARKTSMSERASSRVRSAARGMSTRWSNRRTQPASPRADGPPIPCRSESPRDRDRPFRPTSRRQPHRVARAPGARPPAARGARPPRAPRASRGAVARPGSTCRRTRGSR